MNAYIHVCKLIVHLWNPRQGFPSIHSYRTVALASSGGFWEGHADGWAGVLGPTGLLPVLLAASSCHRRGGGEDEASGTGPFV